MLRIYLFGALRLLHDEQPIKFAALPKTLPLLAYLLLNHTKAVARTTLAFALWPDQSEATARSNLRRHLYELRRVLPAAPDECPWLLIDNLQVQWNPAAPCWCDLIAFHNAGADPNQLADAIALYTGDLLPEVDEEWLFAEREQLRNRYFDILDQLLTQARSQQDTATALRYAHQILQADPLREDTLREVMRLRYANGDRAGALQAYQTFVERLRATLDVPPMVETSALYDSLARQLPESHPTPPTSPTQSPPSEPITTPPLTTPPHALPAQLTSFIGREAELATLRHLLTQLSGATRLVTLTGAGGSGKTRLAVEVGTRLLTIQPPPFADGIFLVPLAAVSDPALVPSAIVTALGIKEQGATSLIDVLKGWLQEKQLLLILDNFEQITAAAVYLVELLQAAPQLMLVVTSRKLLSIYGEHEFPVAPLALPDREDWARPDRMAHSPAVTLFLTRSRAANPNFTLNRDNAAAVAEICTRLDGLPLALELAAARSKLFTPQALLPQLARSLDLLVGAQHGLVERQRTLRQAIDWSFHLLAPETQWLFARLSIFVGEFTLDAATALLPAEVDLLGGIEQLINQSLVQLLEPTEAAEPVLRFRLLLTLREYGLDVLRQRGALAAMQEQHAHYYLARAEVAASEQALANEGYWLDLVAADLDNLRAAFTWAMAQPHAQALRLRLAIAAGNFWLKRGLLAEGRRWLEQALAQAETVEPMWQAQGYSTLGMLAWYQEDYASAQTNLQQSLTCWQALGEAADQNALARIYLSLGGIARQHDNYRAAIAYHTEALAIQCTLNNQQGMADALHNLGVAELYLGEYAAAQERFAECYAIDCALGDQWGIFLDLNSWGVLAYLQEEYDAARTRLEKGVALARDLGAQTRLSLLLGHLGKVALAEAQWADAHRHFQEALAIAEEVGIKSQRFAAHVGLSILLLHEKDDPRASTHLSAALAIWRADRKPKELLSLLDPFALFMARQRTGALTAAIQAGSLLGFADACREQQQLPPREPIYHPLYMQTMTLLQQHLSAEQIAAAYEHGRHLPMEDLLQQLEFFTLDAFRTHSL